MKRTCDQCHGTGVRYYFKGESRFLLSQEECPACCGFGYIETTTENTENEVRAPAAPGADSAGATGDPPTGPTDGSST